MTRIADFLYRVKAIFRNTEIKVCFLGRNKTQDIKEVYMASWAPFERLVIFVQFVCCFHWALYFYQVILIILLRLFVIYYELIYYSP